jgi:hypothetical protein
MHSREIIGRLEDTTTYLHFTRFERTNLENIFCKKKEETQYKNQSMKKIMELNSNFFLVRERTLSS